MKNQVLLHTFQQYLNVLLHFASAPHPWHIPRIFLIYLHLFYSTVGNYPSLLLSARPRPRAAPPLPSSPAPSPSPLGDGPVLLPIRTSSSCQRPPVTSLSPLSLDSVEGAVDPSRSFDAHGSLSCSEIQPQGFR
jgi:hypothetical protein